MKIMNVALFLRLANMQLTDHGWKEDNGFFLPLWFTGSHMPTVLYETIDPTDVSDGKDDDDDNDEDNDNITEDESEDDDESHVYKMTELQYTLLIAFSIKMYHVYTYLIV